MEVSVQFHEPTALIPEKDPPAPVEYEAGWDPEPVWRFGEEKNLLSLSGIERGILGRPAGSRVTVLTELSRLATLVMEKPPTVSLGVVMRKNPVPVTEDRPSCP
jgi:hypothetical protein